MPCRSDYLAPTGREAALQESARLYIYALHHLGMPIPEKVVKAAKDIYCGDDSSVMGLCGLLRGLPAKKRDALVYNAKDRTARQLADWWEEHQEADRKREAAEAKVKANAKLKAAAIKKLSKAELRALGVE